MGKSLKGNYVTNIQIRFNIEICTYALAFRQLAFSADGRRIYNPTDRTLWLEHEGRVYSVASGETLQL